MKRPYNGAMPPMVLDDQRTADVLTFVRNSFGDSAESVSAEEVKRVRLKSRFPTYDALVRAASYPPLPNAPASFTVREVIRLNDHGTRLACERSGRALFVLGPRCDVWRVEIGNGQVKTILRGDDYIDFGRGEPGTVGFTLDAQKRLYIVADQRNDKGPLVPNEVTVFRTTATVNGEPAAPKPWLRTHYPWGIGPFNHGVGHIAFGPDGFLYVSSGSRTDGNEAGDDPRYFKGGEVPLTACVWRLDPRAENPESEIFARGLRNAYGFCWNDCGEMFCTDNGPDADAREELNLIESGRHYGFLYQFANWTNEPYACTPAPPVGVQFTWPIANFGPAAGGSDNEPLYSFDLHSSPAGIVFLGEGFPADHRGSFLVTRFGNLLKRAKDIGFDVLEIHLTKNTTGRYDAHVNTMLAPLGRPLDVVIGNPGKLYVLEYSRQTDNKVEFGMLPGRILELTIKGSPSVESRESKAGPAR